MSKHESWRTRQYWASVGGFLIEEFQAIKADRKQNIGKRYIDGVIVLGEQPGRQVGGTRDLIDKDIIVVQTNQNRLGMYLMGQALFSTQIMARFHPRSIRPVAICGKPDPEMAALCRAHDIEVVVIPDSAKTS